MKMYQKLFISSVTICLIVIIAVCLVVPKELSTKTPDTTSQSTMWQPTRLIDTPILYSDLVCYDFATVEEIDAFSAAVDVAVNNLIDECSVDGKYTAEAISQMVEEMDRLCADQTLALQLKEELINSAQTNG